MRKKITLVYRDVNGHIAEEVIWSIRLNFDNYKIDNIPFFAPNIALGDVISVEEDNGILYFDDLISPSGHSTIQLIFLNKKHEDAIITKLEELGCNWEGMKGGAYYAIDVPPDINYHSIKKYLDSHVTNEVLDYKEACISSIHK